MATAAGVVFSNATPFTISNSNTHKLSLRHFNKLLLCNLPITHLNLSLSASNRLHYLHPLQCSYSNPLLIPLTPFRAQFNLTLSGTKKPHFLHPIECSYSDTIMSEEEENAFLKTLKNLSFDSVKQTLLGLSPIGIIKWAFVFSISIAATKWVVNCLLNPFVWMYFSWTWLFWPWFVALGLGMYGLYGFSKHLRGEANVVEQLAIVTSVFTWLTLVPPAYFNGYLEGWPFVFFYVYHYLFFFNVSVRKRLYGDYYPREHDPKWDISPPNWYRVLFGAGVMAAHWLAAFEGPELHLVPGGWSNFWIWVLIAVTLLMQYNATLYLAKYSENIVVPTSVVQFGPYRLVRHPIYASTMLLFGTYFVALRAPISLLFVVGVCLTYYVQKARLEEALMVETFGERYLEYARRVRGWLQSAQLQSAGLGR